MLGVCVFSGSTLAGCITREWVPLPSRRPRDHLQPSRRNKHSSHCANLTRCNGLPIEFKGYYATIGGGPIEESDQHYVRWGTGGYADYRHPGTRLAYAKTHGKDVQVFGEFALWGSIVSRQRNETKTDGSAYGGGARVSHSGVSVYVDGITEVPYAVMAWSSRGAL